MKGDQLGRSPHRPFYVTTQPRIFLLKQLGIPALLGVPGTETGPWIHSMGALSTLAIPQASPTSEKGMGALRRTFYYALNECMLKLSVGSICTDSVELCGHAVVLAANGEGIPSVLILRDSAEAERCSEIVTQLALLSHPGQMKVVIREQSEPTLPSMPFAFHVPRQRVDLQAPFESIKKLPDNLLIPLPPGIRNEIFLAVAGLQVRSLSQPMLGIDQDTNRACLRMIGRGEHQSNVNDNRCSPDSRVCSPVSPLMGVYNDEGYAVGTIGWHHYHLQPHVLLYDGSIFANEDFLAKHTNKSSFIALFSALMAFHRDNIGIKIALSRPSQDNKWELSLFNSLGFREIGKTRGESCDDASGTQSQWLRRDL